MPTFIFPGQQAPSKAAHHWLPCPANTSSSSVQRRRHGSSCHHHRYFAHCPCHFTANRPKHPQWQQRLSPTALISRPPTGTVRRSPCPTPFTSPNSCPAVCASSVPPSPSIAITAAASLPSLDSIPIPAKVCDWPLGRPIGALLFGSLAALCPYQPPVLPALPGPPCLALLLCARTFQSAHCWPIGSRPFCTAVGAPRRKFPCLGPVLCLCMLVPITPADGGPTVLPSPNSPISPTPTLYLLAKNFLRQWRRWTGSRRGIWRWQRPWRTLGAHHRAGKAKEDGQAGRQGGGGKTRQEWWRGKNSRIVNTLLACWSTGQPPRLSVTCQPTIASCAAENQPIDLMAQRGWLLSKMVSTANNGMLREVTDRQANMSGGLAQPIRVLPLLLLPIHSFSAVRGPQYPGH